MRPEAENENPCGIYIKLIRKLSGGKRKRYGEAVQTLLKGVDPESPGADFEKGIILGAALRLGINIDYLLLESFCEDNENKSLD